VVSVFTSLSLTAFLLLVRISARLQIDLLPLRFPKSYTVGISYPYTISALRPARPVLLDLKAAMII
jgi:hypothetical protein